MNEGKTGLGIQNDCLLLKFHHLHHQNSLVALGVGVVWRDNDTAACKPATDPFPQRSGKPACVCVDTLPCGRVDTSARMRGFCYGTRARKKPSRRDGREKQNGLSWAVAIAGCLRFY